MWGVDHDCPDPFRRQHARPDRRHLRCGKRARHFSIWVLHHSAHNSEGAAFRSPLFWHLDRYPDDAAAEAAKGPKGTVVKSFGTVWLFTIAVAGWKPSTGERVAEIGPLPLVRAEQHAAVYMEGVFKPGMASEVHRHPGVEAWHTVSGEMCVETPKGRFIQRPGDPAIIVPAGQPMELIGTGGSTRESLVLRGEASSSGSASRPSGP